jgi:hypothetical protein
MSYEDMGKFYDPDEEKNIVREEQVIPVMRVYISFVKENQDMLDIPDAVNLLCQNNKSPSENIKELIDKGMINIYACCFNNVHKVI